MNKNDIRPGDVMYLYGEPAYITRLTANGKVEIETESNGEEEVDIKDLTYTPNGGNPEWRERRVALDIYYDDEGYRSCHCEDYPCCGH